MSFASRAESLNSVKKSDVDVQIKKKYIFVVRIAVFYWCIHYELRTSTPSVSATSEFVKKFRDSAQAM